MNPSSRFALVLAGSALLAAPASAQIPDLLNALDAGGRAMATGGANSATNVDTLAAFYNPAALGYLDAKAVDLTVRNLPSSRTRLSGTLANPDSSNSNGRRGGNAIGHLGYAMPLSGIFGKGQGTLAAAYTLGGFVDDHARASSLTDGIFTTTDYRLNRQARTGFYSLAYGRALDNGLSLGLSAVLASAQVRVDQSGTESDGSQGAPVTSLATRGSTTGTGLGALLGALYTPPSRPEWTLGLSLRTPMNLGGNGSTADFYDRIPGRLIFGATYRREGFREGRDYLLLGAQVQSFFGGDGSTTFDRGRAQTGYGFGAEYNLGTGAGRVPLRFGFATVPSGGDGFGSRNAVTFGLGIRPTRFPRRGTRLQLRPSREGRLRLRHRRLLSLQVT